MFLMQNQRKKMPVSYFERARQQFGQGKILVSSDFKVGRCCCSPSFRTIFFYLKMYEIIHFNQKELSNRVIFKFFKPFL